MATKEKFASCAFNDFYDCTELYRSQTGAVFRAFFKYDRKEYILKERKLPELGRRKDIMNEVKLLLQLDHPNVVRCEGWFRDEVRKSLFIVLEYCDGGDLYKLIEYRKLSHNYFDERQIWFIFNQICQGLKHLHENGIVHRDLKSLNIMLTKRGRIFKIGDLGVSRQVSEETVMLNTFYGTPLYLSPELVENKPYNEKTDMWSLGVLLYEMTTFTVPFKANTILALAKQVLKGKYNPISNQYSSHLERCIAWLLQLDYAKRPNVMQVIEFVQGRLSPDYYGQGLGLLGVDSVENLKLENVADSEKIKKSSSEEIENDGDSLDGSVDNDSLYDSDRTASDDEPEMAVVPSSAPKQSKVEPVIRPHTGANLLNRNNNQSVDISKLSLDNNNNSNRNQSVPSLSVNEKSIPVNRRQSENDEPRISRSSSNANAEVKIHPFITKNKEIIQVEPVRQSRRSNSDIQDVPPVPTEAPRVRPQTAGNSRERSRPQTQPEEQIQQQQLQQQQFEKDERRERHHRERARHQRAIAEVEQMHLQQQKLQQQQQQLPPRPETSLSAAPPPAVVEQSKKHSHRKQRGESNSPERRKHKSPEKSRGRSKSPTKVDKEVTVDVQRVHMLLRRVTAQFRKLCQMRDFISNGPTDATSPEGGSTDKKAILEKISELQVSVKILEACVDSGGKMKYSHARSFDLIHPVVREEPRQHQPSPPTEPKVQQPREHKYPVYNANDLQGNEQREVHIANINSHNTEKEIRKLQSHPLAHNEKLNLNYVQVDTAPKDVVDPDERRHDVGGFDVLNHGINGHSKKNDLFKFNAHIDKDGINNRPQTSHGSRKHSGDRNVAFKGIPDSKKEVQYVNHSQFAPSPSNRPQSAMSRLIASEYSDMLANHTQHGSRHSANSTSDDSNGLNIGMMADKYRSASSHRRVISDVTSLNEEKERNKTFNHKNRGVNIITGN